MSTCRILRTTSKLETGDSPPLAAARELRRASALCTVVFLARLSTRGLSPGRAEAAARGLGHLLDLVPFNSRRRQEHPLSEPVTAFDQHRRVGEVQHLNFDLIGGP